MHFGLLVYNQLVTNVKKYHRWIELYILRSVVPIIIIQDPNWVTTVPADVLAPKDASPSTDTWQIIQLPMFHPKILSLSMTGYDLLLTKWRRSKLPIDLGSSRGVHFTYNGLTLMPAWISNHMPSKVWVILLIHSHLNACSVEVWNR